MLGDELANNRHYNQPKMIKFFRKIRQHLLSENKVSKYFVYAIGEIVLVVLGILIALALNNWNEKRKEKLTEIQLYKEIRDDLHFSLIDLESDLEGHRLRSRRTITLRDHLKQKLPLTDSIPVYMRSIDDDWQFFPRTSGFDALKSIGFATLSNDSLREDITNLFQLGFERVVGMGRDKAPVRNFQFLIPFMDKYLKLSDSTIFRRTRENDSIMYYVREISNYEQLLNDELILVKLQEGIIIRQFKIWNYMEVIERTKRLMGEIKTEIDQLEH